MVIPDVFFRNIVSCGFHGAGGCPSADLRASRHVLDIKICLVGLPFLVGRFSGLVGLYERIQIRALNIDTTWFHCSKIVLA